MQLTPSDPWHGSSHSRKACCNRYTRLSSHSTTPTPTPTSSPTSSRESLREYRRVVQLAAGITLIARVGEDPREDVRVGVGVVEFQPYFTSLVAVYMLKTLEQLVGSTLASWACIPAACSARIAVSAASIES